MTGVSISNDIDGNSPNSIITSGQDFYCRVTVTSDAAGNWDTTCGLASKDPNYWPLNVCGNQVAGYGYKKWVGNTTIFRCNTSITNGEYPMGDADIVGFDFSDRWPVKKPECATRTPVTVQ